MADKFPTRPAIAAQQLAQLRRLLDAILPANRFYREKLAGLDTRLSSLDDFRRFPFTTKAELSADQRAFPPYGSNLTYPAASCTRFSPNTVWPAARAACTASSGLVFDTATNVTSSGLRPALIAALAIRSRT